MDRWPSIPYAEWRETCASLHLWSQIIGKYRLAHTPWVNHSWHATLYVTPRGLTTGPVPDPGGLVTVSLDFCDHALVVEAGGGARATFPLRPMSVAEFFGLTKEAIRSIGGQPAIHGVPNEIADVVPFANDNAERPYDADAVRRFHKTLVNVSCLFQQFRTGFIGKVSPVHLFWGSFDLAVTRFSGRPAPMHPGGVPNLPDSVTREAYSHEVSSAGFWPGGSGAEDAMFYSYAYPAPSGFSERKVEPGEAWFDAALGEFLLPYEAVRQSKDPEQTLLLFLESTYRAAADTGNWPRSALECEPGRPRIPRRV
ncbi:hypothetical protein KEU06_21495 [Pseudaminobacter sp. 19-2017]|uniref:Ava_C0101 and related proteins n=1 Tax=Pseudaminobacter soli (ex Zhang et al. 2022) TaxID=2831468 RepID=A0A942E9Z5_9HYPH|nr:DUF5996 family protein [Pseudaminobacter soli]MBS3651192.1 hypothetical protein [Pseudaminobacter soli]